MSLKNSSELENLFSRKPYLRLYNLSSNIDSQTFLKEAKNPKEFYLEWNGRALASVISPKKQAERLFNEKKIKDYHLVILLGSGNPHILNLINSNMRDGQIFLIIDKNFEIVAPLWDEFLFPLLQNAGRHLFAGENTLNLLYNYLESLPIERLTGVLFFRNQNDIQLHKEFYVQIEERISKLFSSKMSDLLTKFEFERIWVKNTIVSILRYSDSNTKRIPIKELENKITGIPGILVSAGPSLRSQCEFIKKNRDKAFILSCDTSLKVLLKFGIIPDGVMTLDAQTHSYFHFMGEDFSEIPLFADMVVSPQLIRSMKFKSIVHSQTAKFQIDAAGKPFRETTAGGDLVNHYIGNQGDIQSGGSVATSAFDLLRFLGINQIFLVGQDLAYTGREIHSTGTHHNEKWLTLVSRKNTLERINEVIVRKRKTKMIPSSDGKEVLTDYVLDIYRHWFEESVLSINIDVKNISSNGAEIRNMQNINIESAEKIFKNIPTHNYPWKTLDPWNEKKKVLTDTMYL
ncbi:MAG: DUF115 domain-containing protein, partial [Spirochaetia bacterium]|nr:DUF115 domain-containing protein [Spirochaetia bacterium]